MAAVLITLYAEQKLNSLCSAFSDSVLVVNTYVSTNVFDCS